MEFVPNCKVNRYVNIRKKVCNTVKIRDGPLAVLVFLGEVYLWGRFLGLGGESSSKGKENMPVEFYLSPNFS